MLFFASAPQNGDALYGDALYNIKFLQIEGFYYFANINIKKRLHDYESFSCNKQAIRPRGS